MKIRVAFQGILSEWIGAPEADFALREGSRLRDLQALIGRRYGTRMPPQLWDGEKNAFVQSVWAMRGSEKIPSPEETLKNGEMIRFWLMQAGG